MKKINLKIDEDLHRKLKIKVAIKGKGMYATIIELIKRYVEE